MAVLLGKWTDMSRRRVAEAIASASMPDDAEYTLNAEWGETSYVMIYQRRPGRGAGTGSTRFFGLEGLADTLKVTQYSAFPPPVEAPAVAAR